MENIRISVSESGQEDSFSVIRVDGVIDTLTATKLEEVLDRLLQRDRFNIILDLAGVDYISSAGWGIFISRIKEIRENKGDIKLANMIPNVFEIYELLEFDNILGAYENINSAKTAFNASPGAEPAKKKDQAVGARTIVEELPSGFEMVSKSKGNLPSGGMESKAPDSQLEEAVLNAVREDPFYSISEIKLVIRETAPNCRIGWWGIFNILRRHKLIFRRSRFLYARKWRKRS
jgi:anti-sigma B factor antagonist